MFFTYFKSIINLGRGHVVSLTLEQDCRSEFRFLVTFCNKKRKRKKEGGRKGGREEEADVDGKVKRGSTTNHLLLSYFQFTYGHVLFFNLF